MQLLKAGATYFALVFGAGFVLGPIRILWLVFEREGLKRHSRKIEGAYFDELYMSKLIEV